MLLVVDAVAVAQFAAGQQVGVAAAANGEGLRAQHHAAAHHPGAELTPAHSHDPVDAAGLAAAAMDGGELLQVLEKAVAHQHQAPGSRLTVRRQHGRARRRPGRAGVVAPGEERAGHDVPGMLIGRLLRLLGARVLRLVLVDRRLLRGRVALGGSRGRRRDQRHDQHVRSERDELRMHPHDSRKKGRTACTCTPGESSDQMRRGNGARESSGGGRISSTRPTRVKATTGWSSRGGAGASSAAIGVDRSGAPSLASVCERQRCAGPGLRTGDWRLATGDCDPVC